MSAGRADAVTNVSSHLLMPIQEYIRLLPNVRSSPLQRLCQRAFLHLSIWRVFLEKASNALQPQLRRRHLSDTQRKIAASYNDFASRHNAVSND
jgi:hypothetical protein